METVTQLGDVVESVNEGEEASVIDFVRPKAIDVGVMRLR